MKGLFQAPQEMVHSYIKSLGYTSNDFSNDFRNWIKGLTSLPTGSNGDMLSQYLASLGYTGSLADKITRWLEVSTLSVGRPQTDQNYFSGVMSQLIALGGLTFYKNYQGASTLDADYSVGSPTAIFTRSTSITNPCTLTDSSGIIRFPDSWQFNRPANYYDTTGFHAASGYLSEADGTNLIIRTDGTAYADGLWTGWTISNDFGGTITRTNTIIPELTSIPGATSQRMQIVVGGGVSNKNCYVASSLTATGSFATGDNVTSSLWIRSLTGNSGVIIKIYNLYYDAGDSAIAEYDSSDITSAISTDWRKVSFPSVCATAGLSKAALYVYATSVDTGDVVDVEIALPQIEKSATATSYIPTKAAAVARSTQATYVDSSGVVTLSSMSDVGRYNSKLYDTTGLLSAKRGVIIEAAGKNLLTRTDGTAYADGVWTGWNIETGSISGTAVKSNVLIPDLTSISGATSQRVSYTAVAGDSTSSMSIQSDFTSVDSVAQNDTITISSRIRSTGQNSGVSILFGVFIYASDGSFIGSKLSYQVASLLKDEWTEISYPYLLNDVGTSRVKLVVYCYNIANGDALNLEIALPQLEKNPYATTYVPTTTAALTRNAEVLKYETAGNRTAAAETIFVKFIPFGTFANDGKARNITSVDTKNRYIQKLATGTVARFGVNSTDSDDCGNVTTTSPQTNISYVLAGVAKHSSPYSNIYVNGVSETTNTTSDFIDNAWGTYFYLGSNSSGANTLNGIIQSVVVFSRALTAAEVLAVSNILAGSN